MPYKDKAKQKQYQKNWWKQHPEYNEQRIEYQRNYWKKNKDRYKHRWINRLGTNQDELILQFIRDKRQGKPVRKYKALPIEAFKFSNQAQQSFPDECRKQEDQFNNNYDGEIKGYKWVEGLGYVTEDPEVFFD